MPVPPLDGARRRRRPGGDHPGGGGAAVRRARGRGQARFRGDRGERGRGRRGGAAAGWDRAGDRARGGAGGRDDAGRAGPAAGAQLRSARCWPPRRRWHITRHCGPRSTGPSSCSPSPNRRCWPGWRCSPAAAPWRPPRRSAAGRVSIPTRCSSCWPASWRGHWWWPRNTGPRPATGCWRRSASTARNASTRPARPSGGGPATPTTTRASSPRIREHAHDPRAEVFWAVRLSAEQDNLLAAWSWAIDTGNVDTAFSILAGFAPSEVWTRYPLLLRRRGGPGAARRGRAPGLPARPRGQRRVRVQLAPM